MGKMNSTKEEKKIWTKKDQLQWVGKAISSTQREVEDGIIPKWLGEKLIEAHRKTLI